jgi:PAS domain S-box-containing protein
MISENAAMTGSYDYGEVSRSIVIAVAASYAALDLAGRVTAAHGRARAAWLTGGAIAMGIGIWAMHFKGMLAFRLSVSVEYHWPTVLASLSVAILASAVALYAASRQKMGLVDALTGSIIMGGGIAGMHYIGLAAMRLPAITRFSPLLVSLSIFLAILFSLVALLMAFDLREETRWTAMRRLGSALVMGAAISAMHYTGMAAATFMPSALPPNLSHAVSISPIGNNGIVIVTFLVLSAAILTSSVDRQAEAEVRQINQGLEHQVTERTAQLEATNEQLRKEIAERERADEALRRSEDRLRLVIDTIPALVWSKFPDGSADFLNQRFREYTGLSVEEGLGEGWLKAIHPEDPASSVAEWRAAFAVGKPFELEARLRRADGEYRWFLFRGEPLRDEVGKIVKWYGTSTDIEDRKQAEWALQEAQAGLSHVTRVTTMGELVAAIAHEVNQPIAAIVTNANFCLRQLASASRNADKLREAMLEIVNDGTRASAVISRIGALLRKGAPKRVAVDINQIIQEVTILLRNEMARNHVLLRTQLGADLPRVSGDGVLLQQVMINLVMNGIEAMSSIKRGPRELVIKSSRDHNELFIQVKDSGVGFDPQQAEHIFEPFFTTKPQGIGMGLSISRSIVESHGGRLWAESHPTGASFQFTLPPLNNGVS